MLNFYPKMMGYSGGGGGGGGGAGGGGGGSSSGGGTGGSGGGAAVGTGVGGLKTNNLCGEGGRNGIGGSVVFGSDENPTGLRIEDHPDLELGSRTHWTIEFWIFLNGSVHGDYDVVLGKGSGTGNNYEYYIEVMSDNTLDFLTTTAGTAWDFQQQITPVLQHDSWHHIALVRNGSGSNSLKSYVNGQEYGSFTAQNIHTSSYPFGIGYYAGYHAGNGLHANITLSNLRFCIGHAVYTSNFTPPTSPLTGHFSNSTDKTSLLCCQNSDNPLEENSPVVPGENLPKTITGFGGLQSVDDTELITNSGFTADISGWTASGVQWSHSSGALMHFGNGSTQRNIFQDVTTVIGSRYVFRVEASSAEANTAYWQIIGNSDIAGNNFIADNNNAAPLEYVYYFTADSTTTKIRFYSYDSSNSSNVRSYWYKASLKLAPQPKAPKNIPPFGTDNGVTFDGAIAMNSSSYMCLPTGRNEERGRGRGFYMLGYHGSPSAGNGKRIDYIDIQSQGNSTKFGDLTVNRYTLGAGANSIRGLFTGGYQEGHSPDTDVNAIEFITIATEGNATDFGDRVQVGRLPACASNDTRCVMASAKTGAGNQDTIDFVTFSTIGNATTFGDLTSARTSMVMSCNSTTRGIFSGGYQPSPVNANINTIEYITFATTGNGTDFGDLTAAASGSSGGTASSSTRGLIGLGYVAPARTNRIDFVTIASTGDAADFGDLTLVRNNYGSLSNSTRGVFLGGNDPFTNTIDFVLIATTGNASDFGDVSVTQSGLGAAGSDSHGGLS